MTEIETRECLTAGGVMIFGMESIRAPKPVAVMMMPTASVAIYSMRP